MIAILIKKCIMFIIAIITFTCNLYSRFTDEKPHTEDYPAIVSAINHENEQEMIEAIDNGADVNEFEECGVGTISPIVWLNEQSNNKRLIKTLLSYNIDPNKLDKSGVPVFYELINDRDMIFDSLMDKNPDLNYIDKDGKNSIAHIISSNDEYVYLDRLQKLINNGAIVTNDNIELCKDTIKNSRSEKVQGVYLMKTLIDNYNGDAIDKNLYAAFSGSFDKNNKCKDDIVLYGIAGYCNSEVLSKNLKKDSDINLLFRIAVMADNIENVKFLYEKGAVVKDESGFDEYHGNALNYAAQYGSVDSAKFLMPLYPDAAKKSMIIASERGQTDVIDVMLKNGADVNNKEAFEAALLDDDIDVVKLFVENGFNLNGSDSLYMDSRHAVWACSFCDLDTIKYVHSKTYKLNEIELNDAVSHAVEAGNIELLEYLKTLGAGFDTLNMNEDGSGPDPHLLVAARLGYFDVIKFLVENGATLKDFSEEDLSYFSKYAHYSSEICNYLTDKGYLTN